MKKVSFIFIAAAVMFITSCTNFLKGGSLTEELQEKIELANNKNPLEIKQATPVFQQEGVPQNTPIKIIFNHSINTKSFEYSIKDSSGNICNAYYNEPVFSSDNCTVYIYFKDINNLIIKNGTTNLTVTIPGSIKDADNKTFSKSDYQWYFCINNRIDDTPPVLELCNFTKTNNSSDTVFKTKDFYNKDLINDEKILRSENVLNYAYSKDVLIYVEGYSDTVDVESVTVKETLVNYSDGTSVKNAKTIEQIFNRNNSVYKVTANENDSFLITYPLKSVLDGAVKLEVYITGGNGKISESKTFKIIKYSSINIEDIKVTNAPNVTYDTWDGLDATGDAVEETNCSRNNFINDICNLRWTITTSTIYDDITISANSFSSKLKYGLNLNSLEDVAVEPYENGYMHANLPKTDKMDYDYSLGIPPEGAVAVLEIKLDDINVSATKTIYFPPRPTIVHTYTLSNNYKYIYFDNAFTPDNKELSTILYTRNASYDGGKAFHITGLKKSSSVFANETGKKTGKTSGLIDTDGDGIKDSYDSDNCIYAMWDGRHLASYVTEDGIYGTVTSAFEHIMYYSDYPPITSSDFTVEKVTYKVNKESTVLNSLIDLNIKVNKSAYDIAKEIIESYGWLNGRNFQKTFIKIYFEPERPKTGSDVERKDNENLKAVTEISHVDFNSNESIVQQDSMNIKETTATISSSDWWNNYMIIETWNTGWASIPKLCSNTCVLEPLSMGGKRIDNTYTKTETLSSDNSQFVGSSVVKKDLNTGKYIISTQSYSSGSPIEKTDYMLAVQRNTTLTDSYFELASTNSNTTNTIVNQNKALTETYNSKKYLFNYTITCDELEKGDYTMLGRLYNNQDYIFYSFPNLINTQTFTLNSTTASFDYPKTTSINITAKLDSSSVWLTSEEGKKYLIYQNTPFTIPSGSSISYTSISNIQIASGKKILLPASTKVTYSVNGKTSSITLQEDQLCTLQSGISATLTEQNKWELLFHSFENNSWENEISSGLLATKTYTLSNASLPTEKFISAQINVQKDKYNQLGQRKIFFNGTACTRGDSYKFFTEDTKNSYWIISDKPALIRVLQSAYDNGEQIENWDNALVVTETLTQNSTTFTNDAFVFDTANVQNDKYYIILAYFADNTVKIVDKGRK